MTLRTRLKLLTVSLIATSMLVIAGCGSSITTETGQMTQSRWGHSAFLLQDGRVLVAGGQITPSKATDTAEIYDPSSGVWTSTGSMSEARGEEHTSTMLADGRVMMIGGKEVVTADIYDPSSGTWSGAGQMSIIRDWSSATLLKDGRVLVAGGGDEGGRDLPSSEVYDPSTGVWSSSEGVMVEGHAKHKSILLDDGKVLLIGQFLSEVYNPESGTWESGGAANRNRALGAGVLKMNDGRILVTGGQLQPKEWTTLPHPTVKAEMYDPTTVTWTLVSDMELPLEQHSMIMLSDGSALVIGDTMMEKYNPATDLWTPVGEMTTPRIHSHTATMLQNGTILVVGGKVETEQGFRGVPSVEIYDPSPPAE